MSAAYTESTQQQQQVQSLVAVHGPVAPATLKSADVRDNNCTTTTSTSVWRMRRLFRRQHHTTGKLNVVARDNQNEVVSTAKHRDFGLEGDRRPTTDEEEATDVDGGAYGELSYSSGAAPGRRRETEWMRVAEVLDRFFFFVFMALHLIPTVTILGFARLFKPEL